MKKNCLDRMQQLDPQVRGGRFGPQHQRTARLVNGRRRELGAGLYRATGWGSRPPQTASSVGSHGVP